MVPDRWYVITEARNVRNNPLGLRRLGHNIVLWRDPSSTIRAAADRCPHKGARLSTGRCHDGKLACPYHGFQFDPDGACSHMPVHPTQKPPAAMRLDTIPVTEACGLVWMWSGPSAPSADVPWFQDVPRTSHTAVSSALEYPVPYSRIVETNFDVYHLPFVHPVVAYGAGAEVADFSVSVEGEAIHTSGSLRGGRGEVPFHVDFLPPSIQRLRFMSFDVVIASTPIDDERAWVWFRYDQGWLRWPPLARLLGWAAVWLELNVVQGREDIPILRTLQPTLPGPGDNVWVGADAGAARYVQWRARQLRSAAR